MEVGDLWKQYPSPQAELTPSLIDNIGITEVFPGNMLYDLRNIPLRPINDSEANVFLGQSCS